MKFAFYYVAMLATLVFDAVDAKGLPDVEIADNVIMPAVNCGHPDDNSTETQDAELWIARGGRGIDTAFDYMNQDQVARAIKDSGVSREKLFITTKISPVLCTKEAAFNAVKKDLEQLELESVDLILHHFPCGHFTGISNEKGNVAVWEGLEEALKQGMTRSIGVSNYGVDDLQHILDLGGTVPAINQCSMSIGNHDDATIEFCKSKNITYEAYSPLRHVDLTNDTLTSIADRHHASTAQIALKWIAQQGIVIATSPGNRKDFVDADLNLGDFELTSEEMAVLSAF